MEKLTEQDGKSLDMVSENLEALKTIFPEVFAEDGVDFEVLRQLLGDTVAEGEEKYGLTWHGKKKARQIALMPSLGTLRPCPEESVDWDTTQNLFIEGDNLEVLKLLQKSYANKVKMIYIDPPYNTGKEFIYPDKFQDNLDTYLKYIGLKNEEGSAISSEVKMEKNALNSGRFHTNWLNMMYPRLRLAKNLLRSGGLVTISIDDNEQANLRKICDEIFGEENFVDQIVWKKRYGGGAKEKHLITLHEYVVVYAKDKDSLEDIFVPLEKSAIKRYYKQKDGNFEQRGPYRTHPLEATKSMGERKNLVFPIPGPNCEEIWPKRQWLWSKERVEKALASGEIEFLKGRNDEWSVHSKQYLYDEDGNIRKSKFFSIVDDVFSQHGTNEIIDLFGEAQIFSFPKPTGLLEKLIDIACPEGGLIVDLFAGSGSFGHASFSFNVRGGKATNFIAVQLPEIIDDGSVAFNKGYKTIAEIGKERIRRAAAKIKEENPNYKGDLGFKVFKLDSSNIRAWNPDRNDLEQSIIDHMEHLVTGRSEEDVLYELLLKRGVALTVPLEEKTIAGKTVYSIGSGVLFACLDTAISCEEVEELAMGIIDWHRELEPASDTQVVFRDSAFANDIAKTNMTAILEQNGVKHVRSI